MNLLPESKNGINLEGKTKIGEETCFREHEERKPNIVWHVWIVCSYLLCGVIDKAHCDASLYSLVHCCYELYDDGETGFKL